MDGDVGPDVVELVGRVRSGDTAAFGSLYREFAGTVHGVAAGVLRDPDAAADVVQETFTRALASIDDLREPARFRAWLLQIARNLAMDATGRGREAPVSDDDAIERVAEPARGPDEAAEVAELAGLVRGVVGGLGRRDAVAVRLCADLGLGAADIAAALGVEPGTARVIVHRAKRRLRDALLLEMLVRRRGTGCPQLARILDHDGEVAAARHVRRCERCADALAEQLL